MQSANNLHKVTSIMLASAYIRNINGTKVLQDIKAIVK